MGSKSQQAGRLNVEERGDHYDETAMKEVERKRKFYFTMKDGQTPPTSR